MVALWNYCAICGKRIEVGDPCLGVEKKNAETDGDSICFDCVKIENINGLDKTVSITDLLARAEAAEACCADLDNVVSEYQEEIVPGFQKLAEKAEDSAKNLHKSLERERGRAEKAVRERDEFKAKYIEAVNRACELSKIVEKNGLEE